MLARLEDELRCHPAEDVTLREEFSAAKSQDEYWRVVCADLVELLIPAEERDVKATAVFAREIMVKLFCVICESLDKEYIWVEGITKILEDKGEEQQRSWADKLLSGVEWGARGVRFVGETLYEAYIEPLTQQNQRQLSKTRAAQSTQPLLLETPLLSLLGSILNLPVTRPWAPSFLQLFALPFTTRSTLSLVLNSRLYSALLRPLKSAPSLSRLLRISRTALFPENHLPPPRAEPDEKEMRRLRENLWREWNKKLGSVVDGRDALGWIQYARRGRLVRRAAEGLIAGLFPELSIREEDL